MKHIDDPTAVGRRIAELRAAREISQRQLAFDGCTPAYISRIEVGARTPSLQVLAEIACRLGTSSAYLVTGRDVFTVEVDAGDLSEQMRLWTSGQETAAIGLEQLTDVERVQLEVTLRQAVRKAAGALARAIQINRQAEAETEARREDETRERLADVMNQVVA